MHRLTNIDREARQADCEACQTRVAIRVVRPGAWRCAVAHSQVNHKKDRPRPYRRPKVRRGKAHRLARRIAADRLRMVSVADVARRYQLAHADAALVHEMLLKLSLVIEGQQSAKGQFRGAA